MKRILIAGLTTLFAASATQAMELSDEMYLVVAAGKTNKSHSAMQVKNNQLLTAGLSDPKLRSLAINSTQEVNDGGFKLQLGYKLNENFAVEGGFVDLGTVEYRGAYTKTSGSELTYTTPAILIPLPIPGFVAGGSIDIPILRPVTTKGVAVREARVRGLNIAGVAGTSVSEDLWVFAKLGAMMSRVKFDDNDAAFGQGVSNKNTWSGLMGVGAEYNFDDAFGLRLEYERYNKLGNSDIGKMNVNMTSLGLVGKF